MSCPPGKAKWQTFKGNMLLLSACHDVCKHHYPRSSIRYAKRFHHVTYEVFTHVHLSSSFSSKSSGHPDSNYINHSSIFQPCTSITTIHTQPIRYWIQCEARQYIAHCCSIIRSTSTIKSSRTEGQRESSENGRTEWSSQWSNDGRGKRVFCSCCSLSEDSTTTFQ